MVVVIATEIAEIAEIVATEPDDVVRPVETAADPSARSTRSSPTRR